jgi:hypothetical protein
MALPMKTKMTKARFIQMLVAAWLASRISGSFAAAGNSPKQNGPLQLLLDQYRLPDTLHIKVSTTTEYKIVPPGLFTIEGTQEYWAKGAKSRLSQKMNSALLPGMSHDVRWDGDHYQWFNTDDSTLIVSRNPRRKTSFVGEPLALLPLVFLNPGGDQLGIKRTLDDLRGDDIRTMLELAHQPKSTGPEWTFPGGQFGDIDTTFHIELGESPAFLPKTIRRISTSGVALSTIELRYQAVDCIKGTIFLPFWATVTDRTSDNIVACVSTWKASVIEADVPIPPEQFTIDYQIASRVIDFDDPNRHAPVGSRKLTHGEGPADQVLLESRSETGASSAVPLASSLSGDSESWRLARLAAVVAGLAAIIFGCLLVRKGKTNIEELS